MGPKAKSMGLKKGKIGLIVNPIAGMGGKVGLKGTDGAEILARARALGAEAVSPDRARRALAPLRDLADRLTILTCPGEMGEDVARSVGLEPVIVSRPGEGETTARDTRRAASEIVELGADMILFAGGDGTARDIHAAIDQRIPMLGIPTGVKMHSAVFATGPAGAGRLAARFVSGNAMDARVGRAEIMDIDEAAQRLNHLSARLYGYANVPVERTIMQNAKAAFRLSGDEAMHALAAGIAAEMEPGVTHIVGPGATTQLILDRLGLEGTLLGVDVVRDGGLVARDANESDLLSILNDGPARIIVGVIGGQGFIFGRGNQQISAPVISRAGLDNITVVASADKLVSLDGRALLVDTGDGEVDGGISGYMRVRTAPGRSMMMKVTPA